MEVHAQRFEQPKVVRRKRPPFWTPARRRMLVKTIPVLIPVLMMAGVIYFVPWTALLDRAWPGWRNIGTKSQSASVARAEGSGQGGASAEKPSGGGHSGRDSGIAMTGSSGVIGSEVGGAMDISSDLMSGGGVSGGGRARAQAESVASPRPAAGGDEYFDEIPSDAPPFKAEELLVDQLGAPVGVGGFVIRGPTKDFRLTWDARRVMFTGPAVNGVPATLVLAVGGSSDGKQKRPRIVWQGSNDSNAPAGVANAVVPEGSEVDTGRLGQLPATRITYDVKASGRGARRETQWHVFTPNRHAVVLVSTAPADADHRALLEAAATTLAMANGREGQLVVGEALPADYDPLAHPAEWVADAAAAQNLGPEQVVYGHRIRVPQGLKAVAGRLGCWGGDEPAMAVEGVALPGPVVWLKVDALGGGGTEELRRWADGAAAKGGTVEFGSIDGQTSARVRTEQQAAGGTAYLEQYGAVAAGRLVRVILGSWQPFDGAAWKPLEAAAMSLKFPPGLK